METRYRNRRLLLLLEESGAEAMPEIPFAPIVILAAPVIAFGTVAAPTVGIPAVSSASPAVMSAVIACETIRR